MNINVSVPDPEIARHAHFIEREIKQYVPEDKRQGVMRIVTETLGIAMTDALHTGIAYGRRNPEEKP